MSLETLYDSLKNTIPSLETLSNTDRFLNLKRLKETPTFLELESKLKNQTENTKQLGLGLVKKHKNKIIVSSLILSILTVAFGIYRHIRLIRYRHLCMEMAKIDHDIATYVLESSNLYSKKTIHLSPAKQDIQWRYRFFKKLNRNKSLSSIQKELNDLKARRVKEAHEFNFDLMSLRHKNSKI